MFLFAEGFDVNGVWRGVGVRRGSSGSTGSESSSGVSWTRDDMAEGAPWEGEDLTVQKRAEGH